MHKVANCSPNGKTKYCIYSVLDRTVLTLKEQVHSVTLTFRPYTISISSSNDTVCGSAWQCQPALLAAPVWSCLSKTVWKLQSANYQLHSGLIGTGCNDTALVLH